MIKKQFIVEKLKIFNEENDWKGKYCWAVVNTQRVEDCFECRNKEVALKLCAFLNKSSDDFKWQISQCEKWSVKVNQLQRENEQLKKEYKIAIDEMVTDYKKLEKENEQLKKEYKIAIDEMVTDYKKLEKENEQLQKELQRFKKYVFSQDNILCYKCEHCIKKDIYVVDCEMKGKVDVHGLCSLFREVKV